VGSARREVLDRVLIFGRRHLERRSLPRSSTNTTTHAPPHQGIGQRRPCEPAEVLALPAGRVERRDRLDGSSTTTAERPDEVTEQGLTTPVSSLVTFVAAMVYGPLSGLTPAGGVCRGSRSPGGAVLLSVAVGAVLAATTAGQAMRRRDSALGSVAIFKAEVDASGVAPAVAARAAWPA
jgi:hypothetical protein